MWFPVFTNEYLQRTLQPVFSELLETDASQHSVAGGYPEPGTLLAAFEQLADVLARGEAGLQAATGDGENQQTHKHSALEPQKITELGEYALVLLMDLDRWIDRLELTVHKESLMELFVSAALWVSDNGGQLLTLESVADALAYFANSTTDTGQLEELFTAYDHIIASVAPAIKQDLEKINPGRPWRVLNLNRAIVATRCHDPDHMKSSFESLIKDFPDDAADFFRKGMEQMDALDYPNQVRATMEQYYSRYTVKPLIH